MYSSVTYFVPIVIVLLPPIYSQTSPARKETSETKGGRKEIESRVALGGNFTTFDRIHLLKQLLAEPKIHSIFLSFLVNKVMSNEREKRRVELLHQEEREEQEQREQEKPKQHHMLRFRSSSFKFS